MVYCEVRLWLGMVYSEVRLCGCREWFTLGWDCVWLLGIVCPEVRHKSQENIQSPCLFKKKYELKQL